ncbi:hypothetical protein W97_01599 [Coniosporium apollinis CBS 100218]|uniref:T6SS Phospholipase effector Tle1-like catalytic domain-containing protein n=1 Tax=Coniosporium apollinis (strain CBS 100218) TaxID=1168221 RepID=R7YKC3_CONA1|nr:uncharacterized protein W97_01599 [Coniosporium apollinis CBS 100218]EON62377.1 hypothetical protein W97_01599 [Coniosporium apollinis CBS 100218]
MSSKPLLRKPSEGPVSHFRKRLIVLCDGTGQDSTANDHTQYPTNVTRFGRAISPWTTVTTKNKITDKEEEEQVEQIVYYQKGVGTNSWLDKRATGAGVAANVRAAYGFLAHNYDPGDEIYFFGYSRGAYTARAIAGMVTKAGLLKKRGMDAFTKVYEAYHKLRLSGSKEDTSDEDTSEEDDSTTLKVDGVKEDWYHDPDSVKAAVRIVGVWDTVEFHKPAVGKFFGYGGEDVEFENKKLSRQIPFGFHALALDERRKAYSPTLWKVSKHGTQTIKQVWFSGRHSDVGGGVSNPRLSDIPLAWMIGECEKTGYLGFDRSYCVAGNPPQPIQWGTSLGSTDENEKNGWFYWTHHLTDIVTLRDREPLSEKWTTNEQIHASIAHRKFGKNEDPGAKDAKPYECKLLTGENPESQGWLLHRDPQKGLLEAELNKVEKDYKGRIRKADEDD